MEIKIHVSSESSRSSDPINNSPSNFKTVFDKPITLDQNKSYLIGLDKIETMTYSWYNINEQYKNNKIRYGVLLDEKDENKKLIILLQLLIILLNSHQEVIVMIISMNI